MTTSWEGPVSVPVSSSIVALVNVSTPGGREGSLVDWHAERRQPAGRSTRYAYARLVYVPGPAVGFGRGVGLDDGVAVGATVASTVGLADGATLLVGGAAALSDGEPQAAATTMRAAQHARRMRRG